MNTSRIPEFSNCSFEGMSVWFSEMLDCGLLFHPDDNPGDMVTISSGEKFFSPPECLGLEKILDKMFHDFGDDVYEAAYPFFMKTMEKV